MMRRDVAGLGLFFTLHRKAMKRHLDPDVFDKKARLAKQRYMLELTPQMQMEVKARRQQMELRIEQALHRLCQNHH